MNKDNRNMRGSFRKTSTDNRLYAYESNPSIRMFNSLKKRKKEQKRFKCKNRQIKQSDTSPNTNGKNKSKRYNIAKSEISHDKLKYRKFIVK